MHPFFEEVREKQRARAKPPFVGRRKPRTLLLPSSLAERDELPWWRKAPAIVSVCIATGEVTVFRWPLPDQEV